MTKKILFGALVLAAAGVLGSCSSEDLLMGSPNQKWKATGTATIDGEDDLTRALSVGGNNGKVLYFNWAGGETLLVRNAAGADAGTMTATVRPGNTAIADIAGEVTGTYSVGDQVTYYYPSVEMDFTGQKGTIADLSSNFHYMSAPVKVAEVDTDNKVVTMGGATFARRMVVLRLRLTDAAGNRLNVEELDVTAASGKLVTKVAADGTKTYGALKITAVKEDGAYPNEFLIALLNDSGAKDTYSITAKVGSSVYSSVTDAQKISANLANGRFYTAVRALTKTVDGDVETTGDFTFSSIEPQAYTGSALTPAVTVSYNGTQLASGTDYELHYFDNTNVGRAFVVAVGKGETYGDKAGVTTFTINSKSLEASMVYAIPDQTYTGSAIEPAVVVKDGGKTLTAGTDYTVTYTDNVNVGTATATITATGNYSGELEKTFNIIRATPVITMTTDAVTLKPEETATRTATTTFGTVSYSSSDTSVATVDATTGKVTAIADGTATITASVAESDNWNAASKQYTVTVKTKSTNYGAISGKFTINASGTKVNFAQGNLRATYDGSSWTWDFHEHQWDYVGNAPGNTKVTASSPYISEPATVDLFGWVGASSTWTGVAQYGITSSTATNNTNGYGNVATESLKSDWGKLIGDGKTWRTLTLAEWTYLFNTRTVNGGTGNGKSYTLGQSVNGKLGVVIYPDGYTGSTYTTGSDWSSFESAGCVFLPAAGCRYGASVGNAGSLGGYWSSSPYTSGAYFAYYVYFDSGYLSPANDIDRNYGLSVRLVCPAQ